MSAAAPPSPRPATTIRCLSTSSRFAQPSHRRDHVVRVVGQRRRFGPAAALAGAAAVVAQDEDARCRRAPSRAARTPERRRSLRRDRPAYAPPTRTTAGWRSRPATPGGVVTVPARLNPLAGIETSASVGLRAVCARVATLDASSRTTRRPTDGISKRTSRSLSSMTTTPSIGAPGFCSVSSKRRVGIEPPGPVSVCSLTARTFTFTSACGTT